jgi:beta-ureidopropionase
MNSLESYSAATVQPIIRRVLKRGQIKDNLNRCLELISTASLSALPKIGAPDGYDGYAPVKLIAFPEFFLQGWTAKADIERYRKEILIEIPGEETDRLAERARATRTYVAGSALEHEPELPDRFLSCAFIIDPRGRIIHKYHKFNSFVYGDLDTAPHDVYDWYLQRYGKGKSALQTFFPVADTEIGKLGTYVSFDSVFPETTRALALNGAEVFVHLGGWFDPLLSHPVEFFKMAQRVRAFENLAYMVAVNPGGYLDADGGFNDELPANWWAGGSFIADWRGVVQCCTDYPGEAIGTAAVFLKELRKRRLDYSYNPLALLRTEVWNEMYKETLYPPNQFLNGAPTAPKELHRRAPTKVIKRLLKNGVFTPS